MSFFGGDPSKSHFSMDVRFKLPNEDELERRQRSKTERQKLKEAGWRKRYYEFKNDDKRGKAQAKRRCEKDARLWTEKTGVPLEVTEGFFM